MANQCMHALNQGIIYSQEHILARNIHNGKHSVATDSCSLITLLQVRHFTTQTNMYSLTMYCLVAVFQ